MNRSSDKKQSTKKNESAQNRDRDTDPQVNATDTSAPFSQKKLSEYSFTKSNFSFRGLAVGNTIEWASGLKAAVYHCDPVAGTIELYVTARGATHFSTQQLIELWPSKSGSATWFERGRALPNARGLGLRNEENVWLPLDATTLGHTDQLNFAFKKNELTSAEECSLPLKNVSQK